MLDRDSWEVTLAWVRLAQEWPYGPNHYCHPTNEWPFWTPSLLSISFPFVCMCTTSTLEYTRLAICLVPTGVFVCLDVGSLARPAQPGSRDAGSTATMQLVWCLFPTRLGCWEIVFVCLGWVSGIPTTSQMSSWDGVCLPGQQPPAPDSNRKHTWEEQVPENNYEWTMKLNRA